MKNMKIKKAFEICKKQGVIRIYRNDFEEQYLSDGAAIYPIFELPNLNEDYICKLYDITDAQRDKIAFDIVKGAPGVDVSDSTADETPAEMWDIRLSYNGATIIPIATDEGTMFINQLYLKPFTDMPQNDMQITKRVCGNMRYFCIKFGMLAYGFIAPMNIVTKDFVAKLERLYNQSKIILINQRNSENETV